MFRWLFGDSKNEPAAVKRIRAVRHPSTQLRTSRSPQEVKRLIDKVDRQIVENSEAIEKLKAERDEALQNIAEMEEVLARLEWAEKMDRN